MEETGAGNRDTGVMTGDKGKLIIVIARLNAGEDGVSKTDDDDNDDDNLKGCVGNK